MQRVSGAVRSDRRDKSGEIDGVAKEFRQGHRPGYRDICYMTKCPYVPPHPWDVDFPHVMLRAKAIKFRQGGPIFVTGCGSSTDRLGSWRRFR
jgi:hypothetical protein